MRTEIRILRIKNGLSQTELAKRLGTYPRRISRFERGEATLKANELKKLREILTDG